MIVTHYGATLDSELPTTGVFQNNHIDWLGEVLGDGDTVDLSYEEALDEYVGERLRNIQVFLDNYVHGDDIIPIITLLNEIEEPNFDCHESLTSLVGFKKSENREECWYWLSNLQYGFLPNNLAEYSAIVGEIYTQVIKSEWVLKGSLCSPCYPGQVDSDSTGKFIGYSFPPDAFEKENPLYSKISKWEDKS